MKEVRVLSVVFEPKATLLISFRQESVDKGKSLRKESKKNFRKDLEDMLESCYLCIRFLKRNRLIFERFT